MRRLLFALSAIGVLGVFAAPAGATTFTNPGPIAINDSSTFACPPSPVNQAPASPYPSQIPVSGLGAVSDVNVTLSGYSHTSPPDVRALLVGPQGQSTQLMSDVGSDGDATNLTITFDDAAPTVLPNPLVSGTFKPSQETTGCPTPMNSLSFPSPAPLGPYGTSLAGFNGTNPNGAWSLYVVDDFQIDSGSIAGGWRLDIAAPPAAHKKKCKKHKKHHSPAAAKKKCKKKKKHH
jgi:hypothetical protein